MVLDVIKTWSMHACFDKGQNYVVNFGLGAVSLYTYSSLFNIKEIFNILNI